MGGSKNKSPAQKEKSQKKDGSTKKSKKSEKKDDSKTKTSVIIDEVKATKYVNDAKVITVQDLARQTNVKISEANSFLQKLLKVLQLQELVLLLLLYFRSFQLHHIMQV